METDRYPKLIDVSLLVSNLLRNQLWTGLDRVTLAYVRRYRQNALALVCSKRRWSRKERWLCMDENSSQKIFDTLLFRQDNSELTLRTTISKAHLIDAVSLRGRLLFNTAHRGLEKPDYSKSVIEKKVKPFYFLHDLIPLMHPEHCNQTESSWHSHRLLTMINTGCALILNSQDTKQCLLSYAKKNHWVLPRLLVAPLGIEFLPKPNCQMLIEKPYFVMLGTIESRKNHLLILNVWRRLAEKKTNPMPKLILIGYRGWECEQVFDMLDRCAAIRDHVIEISNCNDEMLSTYLYHAQALLFPTFSEGYGLPLVEALSLSVPVIASNLNVFQEIAGPVPDYLDPIDGLGWLNLIENYSKEDSFMRKAQLERMQNFKVTTWEDHFNLVDNFLEKFTTNCY